MSKRVKSISALLLALALVFSAALPQNAAVKAEDEITLMGELELVEEREEEIFAEEPDEDTAEAPVEEPAEASVNEPVEEAAEEPVKESAEEAETEPAEAADELPEEPDKESEPEAEPEAEPQINIDSSKPVSENPEFRSGYVMIVRDTEFFKDKTGGKTDTAIQKAQYAYAAARVNIGTVKERLFVAVNADGEALEGYISVQDARPLSSAEVDKYYRAAGRDASTAVYGAALLVPCGMKKIEAAEAPVYMPPDAIAGDGKTEVSDASGVLTFIPGPKTEPEPMRKKAAFSITGFDINYTQLDKDTNCVPGRYVIRTNFDGGVAPYTLKVILYRNDIPYAIADSHYSTASCFDLCNCDMDEPGEYFIGVRAYDGAGAYIEAYSAMVYTAKTFKFVSFKPSAAVGEIGTSVTFSASTTGGEAPFTYIYRIFKDGKQITNNKTQSDRSFKYVPTSKGKYYARVTVKDCRGRSIALNSSTYYVSPKMTITRVSTGVSKLNAGESTTYSVGASGGITPYRYRFVVYSDGKVVEDSGFIKDRLKKITFKKSGKYYVKGYVKDAYGLTKNMNSTTLTVGSGSSTGTNPVTYRAVVVGQSYNGTLFGPGYDAIAVQAMLGKLTSTKYTVSRYTDLNTAQILNAIKTKFAGADSNDVSLFFYSGHGLNASYYGGGYNYSWLGSLCGIPDGDYLSPSQLRAALDKIPGKKVVVINACHSGNMIGAENNRSKSVDFKEEAVNDFTVAFVSAFADTPKSSDNLAGSNYYVLCASRYDQTSTGIGYSDGTGESIFTQAFNKACGWNMRSSSSVGLLGDSNGNKRVSIDEAYQYIKRDVKAYIDEKNSKNNMQIAYQSVQVYPLGSTFEFAGR